MEYSIDFSRNKLFVLDTRFNRDVDIKEKARKELYAEALAKVAELIPEVDGISIHFNPIKEIDDSLKGFIHLVLTLDIES